MTRRSKHTAIIALLLFLGVITMAQAKDKVEILIDSSRNAVIKLLSGGSAKDVSGSVEANGDFAKGQMALKSDLKFAGEVQKDLGDGTGAAYLSVAADKFEVVGTVDVPVPKEGDMPSKVDLNLDSVMTEKAAYTKGTLGIAVPNPGDAPKMSFDMSVDGGADAGKGKLDMSFDLPASEAANAPFKKFELTISEKEAITTIVLNVAVDGKSPGAAQLKQMGKNPDQLKQMVEQNLGNTGVQIDKVEVGEFKDTPEEVSGSLTIALKDWRGTLSTALAGMSESMGDKQADAKKMTESLNKMLETRLDNLAIKFTMDGNVLKGTIDLSYSNAGQFLVAYADFYETLMYSQQQEMADQDGEEAARFLMAFNTVNAAELKKMAGVMAETKLGIKGTAKLTVDPVKEGDKPSLNIAGNLDMNFENFKAYADKASAAGLPVGKNHAAIFKLTLNDAGRLNGQFYAYSDAKALEYYKNLVLGTLQKMGGAEKAAGMIQSVELKGGQLSFQLSKDGLNGAGYLETSDLTPVLGAVVSDLAKDAEEEFSGTPTGFAAKFNVADGKGTAELAAYFSKFMEGKSKEDIASMSGAEVNDKASADDVKLVAVAKPEVKVPESLVALQKEGEAKWQTAVASTSGGGAGGGGGKALPIIGGVVLLVLAGVGFAAGKKKS